MLIVLCLLNYLAKEMIQHIFLLKHNIAVENNVEGLNFDVLHTKNY